MLPRFNSSLNPFYTIPTGRAALITYSDGQEEEMAGPKRIWRLGKTIRMFSWTRVDQGDRVTVFDESGKSNIVTGPEVVNIHPNGELVEHTAETIADNEVIVVVGEDGQRTMYSGRESVKNATYMPRVFIGPFDTVHNFKWMGSDKTKDDPDGLYKVPAGRTFKNMRIGNDQFYLAFVARTSDGTEVQVNLAVSYAIVDPWLAATANHDPLSVIFNRVIADGLNAVSMLALEDLRPKVNASVDDKSSALLGNIQDLPVFEDDGFWGNLGFKFSGVVLRGYKFTDLSVQRVMDAVAMASANMAKQQVEHTTAMQALENKRLQMEKEKDLDDLAAQQAKKKEGDRAHALLHAFQVLSGDSDAKMDPGMASKVLRLDIARMADQLTIGRELTE